APGAAGRQGRRERPRPARRLPAVGPLGRAPLADGQGRLVRAARPAGDRGRDAPRDGDRAPDLPLSRSTAARPIGTAMAGNTPTARLLAVIGKAALALWPATPKGRWCCGPQRQ